MCALITNTFADVGLDHLFEPEICVRFVFLFGGLYFASTTAVSVSVFFLLVERCAHLIAPSSFREHKQRIFALANAASIVLQTIAALTTFILFERPDFSLPQTGE